MVIIIGLLALLPVMLWMERAQRFKAFSPVEQNLQRASHGAALIVLMLVVGYGNYGARGAVDLVDWVIRDPAGAALPALLIAGMLLYGIARFLAGVRRGWGMRDGLLATRALIKLGIGAGITFWFMSKAPLARLLSPPDSVWWVMPLFLVGICWGGRPHGIAKACQGLVVRTKQGSRPHGV